MPPHVCFINIHKIIFDTVELPSLEALLTLSPLPRKSSPGTKEEESIFKCEDCNEMKLGGK